MHVTHEAIFFQTKKYETRHFTLKLSRRTKVPQSRLEYILDYGCTTHSLSQIIHRPAKVHASDCPPYRQSKASFTWSDAPSFPQEAKPLKKSKINNSATLAYSCLPRRVASECCSRIGSFHTPVSSSASIICSVHSYQIKRLRRPI